MSKIKYNITIVIGLFLSACTGDIDNNRSYFASPSSNTTIQDIITPNNCDQTIVKTFSTGDTLTICYDYTYKSAKYVSYRLDGSLVHSLNISQRANFYVEPQIPSGYEITSNDYISSGYDRGHLAPDASFDYNQGDLKIIYSMANIIPQDHTVNGTFWIKAESYARAKAVEYGEVDILNGVVFDSNPKYINAKIAISIGFWKQISNSEQNFKECYYYDNFINIGTDINNDTLDSHKRDCSSLVK